eukprot:6836733-Pyramimonas_sp.AAC.1
MPEYPAVLTFQLAPERARSSFVDHSCHEGAFRVSAMSKLRVLRSPPTIGVVLAPSWYHCCSTHPTIMLAMFSYLEY